MAEACKACGGTGGRLEPNPSDQMDPIWVKCSACKGSGKQ